MPRYGSSLSLVTFNEFSSIATIGCWSRGLLVTLLICCLTLCCPLYLSHLSFLRPELVDELRKFAALRQQLRIGSALDDFAIVDETDFVDVRQHVETVRDEDACLLCKRTGQKTVVKDVLGNVRVDSGKRVVNKGNVARVIGDTSQVDASLRSSPSQSEQWAEVISLYLLTTREIDAVLADLGPLMVG